MAEPPLTVGQRLRAAREAAGLTTDDVARSLKFSPRQIELLEADNYSALPGNTVVRGFTRNYARLLKLDADELLDLLGEHVLAQPADVRPPDNMGMASDERNERRLSPLLSAAIVVALAALILAVWHFFGPDARKAAEVKKNTTEALAPPADIRRASSEPGAEAAPGDAATGGPASPSAMPSASSSLIFSFDDRSWVEVTDGARQVLHRGENPAGSRLVLDGKPPFDIVIGNAAKVKLTHGGREVDLAPHTRVDVARFRLE